MLGFLIDPYIWAMVSLSFLILEVVVGTELIFPPLALASGLMIVLVNVVDFTSIEIIAYTVSGLTVLSVVPFWCYKEYRDKINPSDINNY